MTRYSEIKQSLLLQPKTWLITGVAGFIGSNLLETLLKLNQSVVGLDNFSTGHQKNLDEVKALVTPEQWSNFQFIEGDIRDMEACRNAMTHLSRSDNTKSNKKRVDYVLHQAALGSVPRSINDPATTNDVNISGFLNILIAARDAEVKSFTYAASSSTYGSHEALPKKEDIIGSPLSPYAVTKYVNELYADVFFKTYNFNSIGLRYFNVFGKRQDPDGAYAAVIPKWTAEMIRGGKIEINGDGDTSRDFCFIANAVQANLLAATNTLEESFNNVYNVAYGGRTSLNQLFSIIQASLKGNGVHYSPPPIYKDFRPGDVRHSQADISKAKTLLGYMPENDITSGIELAMPWYIKSLNRKK